MGAVFISHLGASREIFYLVARDDCHVLRTVQLTATPNADEQAVKAAVFGELILVVWREGASDTKAGIINLKGDWVTKPAPLGQPIPQNHDLTTLPNGDVAWLAAEHGGSELLLVQVTQAAGARIEAVMKAPAKIEPKPAMADSDLSTSERAVLDLVNRERTKVGLAPYRGQAQLARAARNHSTNMARQGNMNHTLDGKDFAQRIRETGYQAGAGGENIAHGARTPGEVMSMWMNSPGHKANILSGQYQEIGVGIADSPQGKHYTLVFAAPRNW